MEKHFQKAKNFNILIGPTKQRIDIIKDSTSNEDNDKESFNTFQTYHNHLTQDGNKLLTNDDMTIAQLESEIQKDDNEVFPSSFKTYSNISSLCATPTGIHSKLDKFKLLAGLKFKDKIKSRKIRKQKSSRKGRWINRIPFRRAHLKFSPEYEKIRNAFNKSNSRSELDNILKSKKMDISNQHYDWSFAKTEEIYLNVRSSEQNHNKTINKFANDLSCNDVILKRFIESRKKLRDGKSSIESNIQLHKSESKLQCEAKSISRQHNELSNDELKASSPLKGKIKINKNFENKIFIKIITYCKQNYSDHKYK